MSMYGTASSPKYGPRKKYAAEVPALWSKRRIEKTKSPIGYFAFVESAVFPYTYASTVRKAAFTAYNPIAIVRSGVTMFCRPFSL